MSVRLRLLTLCGLPAALCAVALAMALALGSAGCAGGAPLNRTVERPSPPTAQAGSFSLQDAPAYAGTPSAQVNGGVPFFSAGDFARGAFEEYAPLDERGRCGAAFALIGTETMPDEERGSIGMVRPSGWRTVRYDWVDGGYLFNRCHLIGYQLAGENANERNLITGTRTLNVEGMLPYENRVFNYVRSSGNHVLYRATPLFEGDELVARGVLLEAASVEDRGNGLRFCAWCYNVEPGVEIDYATGNSHASAPVAQGGEAGDAEPEPESAAQEPAGQPPATEDAESAAAAGDAAPAAPAAPAAQPPAEGEGASEAAEVTYVLNTRSRKFHYPGCPSVDEMAEHNKRAFYGTREEAVALGYQPCGRCNP